MVHLFYLGIKEAAIKKGVHLKLTLLLYRKAGFFYLIIFKYPKRVLVWKYSIHCTVSDEAPLYIRLEI